MPVYPNTLEGRHRREAFEIIDQASVSPLLEAIQAARLIKNPSERCHAWIKVAEFVYAKPRQSVEVSGHVSLEQLLGHWDQPKQIGVGE